jgi:hypothetical protein
VNTRGAADMRAIDAVVSVLPPRSEVRVDHSIHGPGMVVNGHRFTVSWVGEGRPDAIRRVIATNDGNSEIVVGRHLSVSARKALSGAGIGWVDESGAAQIAGPGVMVALSGTPAKRPDRPSGWTPSVIAVAEALLCEVKASASAVVEATGLSMGAASTHFEP